MAHQHECECYKVEISTAEKPIPAAKPQSNGGPSAKPIAVSIATEECECFEFDANEQGLGIVAELDANLLQFKTRVPPKSGLRASKWCSGGVLCLGIVLFVLAMCALISICYGYYRDVIWDDVIGGQRAMPFVPTCKYFEGRTFAPTVSDDLKDIFRRPALMEIGFIVYIVLFLLCTFGLISTGRVLAKFVGWFIVCGLMHTILALLLLRVVYNGNSSRYIHAHHLLSIHAQTLNATLHPKAMEQVNVLQDITVSCRQFPVVEGDGSITILGETCSLDDLSTLGFCQHHFSKLCAVCFSFLLALVCWSTCIFSYVCPEVVEITPAEAEVPTEISYVQQKLSIPRLEAYRPAVPILKEDEADLVPVKTSGSARSQKEWLQYIRNPQPTPFFKSSSRNRSGKDGSRDRSAKRHRKRQKNSNSDAKPRPNYGKYNPPTSDKVYRPSSAPENLYSEKARKVKMEFDAKQEKIMAKLEMLAKDLPDN